MLIYDYDNIVLVNNVYAVSCYVIILLLIIKML